MEPQRNLVIIHWPKLQAISDWTNVSEKIHERAPDIEVRIVDAYSSAAVTRRWQGRRPSLVFSASGWGEYRPNGGSIACSRKLQEKDQYSRWLTAGVSTPRAIEMVPGMVLRPDVWGKYVIVKPQGKTKGSDLRLIRTEDVGPRYFSTLYNTTADPVRVKRYINSVDKSGYPIEYRVLTLFGTVLYAARIRTLEKRPPLEEFAKDLRSIPSSDDTRVSRERSLAFDEDVLQLARNAAKAIPESACLGIDILRDLESNALYVIEANAGGVWHLSSDVSNSYDPAFRRSLYTQFNALDLIADLLIEKTRSEAS